jgi:flagellar basal body-associated protein FliL
MKFWPDKHNQTKFIVGYTIGLLMFASCGAYVVSGSGMMHRWMAAPHRFVQGHAYYDLPRMMTSMNSDGKTIKLRLDMSLEVANGDVKMLGRYQPRVTDRLNKFLGQVPAEQIECLNSSVWLRNQLLTVVNGVGLPVKVSDVVFREYVLM